MINSTHVHVLKCTITRLKKQFELQYCRSEEEFHYTVNFLLLIYTGKKLHVYEAYTKYFVNINYLFQKYVSNCVKLKRLYSIHFTMILIWKELRQNCKDFYGLFTILVVDILVDKSICLICKYKFS